MAYKIKTLQSQIIERFLEGKKFNDFMDEYVNAKKRHHRGRDVTPLDRKIMVDWRNGLSMSEVVRKYKKSVSFIKTAIVLVSREK